MRPLFYSCCKESYQTAEEEKAAETRKQYQDKYKIFLLHIGYLVTTAPSPRISCRSRSIFFSGEVPMPTAFIYLPCEIS